VAGSHAVMRGSRFSVTFLESLPSGAADPQPLAPDARPAASALAERFAAVVNAELPRRNALTDAQRPARQRWAWLGRLFH
jgi:hypothetical protein